MPSSVKAKIISRVRVLVESLLESEGMELVHLEYRRESKGCGIPPGHMRR